MSNSDGPSVTPEIVHPGEIDADRNGVDDVLDRRLREIGSALALEPNPMKRAAIEAELGEPVRVELFVRTGVVEE